MNFLTLFTLFLNLTPHNFFFKKTNLFGGTMYDCVAKSHCSTRHGGVARLPHGSQLNVTR
jgi:hypothetical protein